MSGAAQAPRAAEEAGSAAEEPSPPDARDTLPAQNTWKGHLWSREDDRGHFERTQLRAIALKHKISLTQAYLILDEGIRAKWPAPDGEPLPGTTPPLNPRSTW